MQNKVSARRSFPKAIVIHQYFTWKAERDWVLEKDFDAKLVATRFR